VSAGAGGSDGVLGDGKNILRAVSGVRVSWSSQVIFVFIIKFQSFDVAVMSKNTNDN
jgi:hypothetical protein